MQLCHIDDIAEGASKGFELADRNLFAVRRFGQIYLYENSCPHVGVALDWLPDQFLDSDGELIQCSSHGALFVIETGACIAGPCAGQALTPVAFHLQDGFIHLSA